MTGLCGIPVREQNFCIATYCRKYYIGLQEKYNKRTQTICKIWSILVLVTVHSAFNMSDFYTLGPTSSPTRVISIEPTLQGGSCRSCGQTLKQGELRIKVAYPNIFVHYYTKSGTPSFFMHPFCFEINPVDFCHGGKGAYNDVLPIKGFAINPSKSVAGY